MLLIPPKLLHVIEAVLYIALQPGATPVNGKVLAGMQNVPPRYLESMLQQLVHGGILRSIRGPRGGYLLLRERRNITLGDILLIFKEDESPRLENASLAERIVRPVIQEASDQAFAFLKHISIAELCDSARLESLVRQTAHDPHARADYEI